MKTLDEACAIFTGGYVSPIDILERGYAATEEKLRSEDVAELKSRYASLREEVQESRAIRDLVNQVTLLLAGQHRTIQDALYDVFWAGLKVGMEMEKTE